MNAIVRRIGWVVLAALVVLGSSVVPGRSQAQEDSTLLGSVARLEALAAAHSGGVPVGSVRSLMLEIVANTRLASKRICIPSPCTCVPYCSPPPPPPPFKAMNPAGPRSASELEEARIMIALRALEREARTSSKTIPSARLASLAGELRGALDPQAAQ